MRRALQAIVAALAIWAAGGCGDKVTTPTPKSPFRAATSPESVIANFDSVFNHRNLAWYDSTLASGYCFRFQPADIQQGPDSLARAEEMTFASHLFVSGSSYGEPAASRISLSLTIQSSGNDPRPGHEGWKRYVVSTHLLALFANENSGWEISSPAWLYFKQQPAGSGRWRLAEWADMPGYGSAAGARGGARAPGADGTRARRATSWGRLKRMYRSPGRGDSR